MSIDFACPKCKKQYRVKEELAGKSAKCKKCGQKFKVPVPALKSAAVDDLANEGDLSDWFADELSGSTPAYTPKSDQPSSSNSTKPCPACGSSLAVGAVLCVACGYDTRSGKKHATRKVVEEKGSKGKAAVKQTASLARGALFSAIGASLGVAVWVAVAIFADLEIGWIAWGLGFAAGAGMAFGHEDDDGTLAGIVAAGISILGVIAAKFFIFEHFKSTFVGEEISFASLFGPIDGIFILLAVASAYKLGSGQVSD